MFYTYALPFDSAGAVQYSTGDLGVASTQVAVSTQRTTGIPCVVGTKTLQFAGAPGPNPFTLEFSREFGAGFRFVLLTVNKILDGATSAELSAITPLRQVPIGAPLDAAQGQSSSISWSYFAVWLIQVASPSLATLYFPRLNQSVLAARSPNVARQGRGYGLAFGVNTPSNWFSDEFTDEFGVGVGGHAESLLKSVNSIGGGTSTQSSTLASGIRKLIGLASASSALILRGPGRIPRAVSSNVARRLLQPAKLVGAAVGEASGIARAAGVSKHAASSQSPLLSFGGNLYARIARVATAQSLTVARSLFVLRGAVTVGRTAVIRSIARILGVAETASTALARSVAAIRGVSASTAVLVIRSVGIPRRMTNASVAVLSVTSLHLAPILRAAQGIVAGLSAPSAALGYLKNLAVAQASLARLSSQQAYYRLLSAAQAQGAALVRGLGHSMTAALASTVSSVKSVGKSASIAASSIGSVVTYSAHALLLGVGMVVSQAALRAARSFRGAATAQSASVSLGTGKIVPEIVGAVSAGAASIVRLTMKLLDAVSRQVITHIRGVVSISLHVTTWTPFTDEFTDEFGQPGQMQVAHAQASRALYIVTVQPQRARIVSWFHLFVPDWAYQQTVLLPPSGGPAEPPAFGAIDPADQTTFAFDWSARADFNDPIVSATVTSSPPGMSFLGPVFTGGTLVEVTVLPFTPKQLPMTYRLRCTAVFASGRRSSFSIPVPVRTL